MIFSQKRQQDSNKGNGLTSKEAGPTSSSNFVALRAALPFLFCFVCPAAAAARSVWAVVSACRARFAVLGPACRLQDSGLALLQI